ncbi:hypothetical protein EKN06_13135 [Croceicoccus ponticola]|uniref:Uncharacterized protein n=1 Tax=Croceicoccus ponticola TaxID=2217664 RepID=A0A437GUX9_9SPHN|nr:hypothetical protein [Croceicoccus ponticola]RVQ65475.1 hypothetical protein EKN06_13135 [Croceicoccus ponticola]
MTGLFESDAANWAALALAALVIAAWSIIGDRRRSRRAEPDRVGCVPWAPVFLLALFAAGVAAFFALATWLSPV